MNQTMTRSQPLAHFIRKNLLPISEEWEKFAKMLSPHTSGLILRNHIHAILFYIADDIESPQSDKQQLQKAHGEGDAVKASPGGDHGVLRYKVGFNMVQMMAEYRALRACITRLWTGSRIVLTDSDISDLIRFNEAIDQLLAQSVASFIEQGALVPERLSA
jgi:hypothetical protein